MQKFVTLFAYYVAFTAALATPNSASSIPPGSSVTPVSPTGANVSVDSYLSQLFGPLEGFSPNTTTSPNYTLSARSNRHTAKRDAGSAGNYREYYGIHELSWENATSKTSYTLALDLSDSCTGLNLSSPIGVYTFTNGTTTPSTKLGEIIEDVWSLKPTPSDPRRRWANHTATLAQIALDEANDLLTTTLICSNSSNSTQPAVAPVTDLLPTPLHNELRHLLSSAWSYWCATIISTVFGAALGASFAAGIQHHFSGNITAQNVVQTAAVVGATVLIGGILMRLHENGRIDHYAEMANRRALAGRQAMIQNVHIARWRELLAEARRVSTDRAWEASTNRDIGGFSNDGGTSPGSLAGGGARSSLPETPGGRSSGNFYCLSDSEAVDALRALGQMSSDELRIKMMTTIREHELERMENGEAGSTIMGPSELDMNMLPSRPESHRGGAESGLCRVFDSQSVSFRTAMGGFEASAQDLVELGNLAKGNEAESDMDPSSSGSGGNGGYDLWGGGGQTNGGQNGAANGEANGGAADGGANGAANGGTNGQLGPDDKGKGRADDQGGG